jgi:hypothetical protein
MMVRLFAVLVLLFAGSTPALAEHEPAAGRVKVVSGTAFIVRAGSAIAAAPGQAIFSSDTLRTSGDGSIGVTFKDDTRLSLGPSSEVKVEKFVYAPQAGGLAMVIRFVRGVTAYVSGRIAKLAPDAVRLETPAAIVGVRGTTLVIRVQPE